MVKYSQDEICRVSCLGKTWVFDLDGTLVKHNGYKTDGHDTLLDGIDRLLSQVKKEDMVVIVTARDKGYAAQTERFLAENGIHYDHIIYNAPYGERILINDRKPSGLPMSVAIDTDRDRACRVRFEVDEGL